MPPNFLTRRLSGLKRLFPPFSPVSSFPSTSPLFSFSPFSHLLRNHSSLHCSIFSVFSVAFFHLLHQFPFNVALSFLSSISHFPFFPSTPICFPFIALYVFPFLPSLFSYFYSWPSIVFSIPSLLYELIQPFYTTFHRIRDYHHTVKPVCFMNHPTSKPIYVLFFNLNSCIVITMMA